MRDCKKPLPRQPTWGAEFVLFGGDNAETDRMKDEAQADSLHARFKRIVDGSGIPAYFTMGNHDRFYECDGQRDTLGFRMFEKHYGATCYSFTRQGVHFVVLNALHPAQGKPYWVDDEQLAWLQADLEQVGEEIPVILSTHVPLLSLYYPVVDGTMKAWDMVYNSKAVVDLLKQYDTRLVLQGHQHLYEQIYERDLWFVTAGAVSADWWKGPFAHYRRRFFAGRGRRVQRGVLALRRLWMDCSVEMNEITNNMKQSIFALLTMGACMISCNSHKSKLAYPDTHKEDVVDTYFGVEVRDPYRWLEDDRSEATARWVKAQNALTFDYLDKIPFREALRGRLSELNDYPKYGSPFKRNGKYYFFKNDGLQPQSVLYVQDSLDAEPQVLLDPNTLSDDGTVALSGVSFSKDGRYLAYSIARSGSDWNEIYVMDLATRQLMPDHHIEWVKFSNISWYKDGFYYCAYDAPQAGSELSGKNEYQKVFYHSMARYGQRDRLVFEDRENPLRTYAVGVTDDERYVYLYETESTSATRCWWATRPTVIPASRSWHRASTTTITWWGTWTAPYTYGQTGMPRTAASWRWT